MEEHRTVDKLADVIDRLHDLPSPRGVALELVRLAQRENAAVADVVRVVRADPALAGKLIHAANRANAGRRTGLLNEAVMRLGFSATRQIALGFSLVNDYRSGCCAAFDYTSYWTGSLLRGVAAQVVAARAGGFDPQEAFVCGLLAGVGRLALATAQPLAYAELLGHEGGGVRLRRAERERFATDHAELGVALLQRWNLPEAQVRTVSEFLALLAPEGGPPISGSRRSWIMVLAEALAQGAVAGSPPAWQQVASDTAAHLDLDNDAVSDLCADSMREMSAWAPLLDLPVPVVAADGGSHDDYDESCAYAAGSVRPLNIVLVDDNEADRYLAGHVLEEAGHNVQAVADGDEALSAILSTLPQMVITDWEMPGMDGVALCSALRAARMGRDIYVIMYSGRCRGGELLRGIEAGADDFSTKSDNFDALLARVRAGARTLRRVNEMAGEFRGARHLAVELAVAAGRDGSCDCAGTAQLP